MLFLPLTPNGTGVHVLAGMSRKHVCICGRMGHFVIKKKDVLAAVIFCRPLLELFPCRKFIRRSSLSPCANMRGMTRYTGTLRAGLKSLFSQCTVSSTATKPSPASPGAPNREGVQWRRACGGSRCAARCKSSVGAIELQAFEKRESKTHRII